MNNPRIELINARKSAGLTQKQLAESVGISRAFLTNIELGKYEPSLKVAGQIAATLSRDINDLFFNCDVREKNIRTYKNKPTGTCG